MLIASHSSLAEMWAKNILSNQIVFKVQKDKKQKVLNIQELRE